MWELSLKENEKLDKKLKSIALVVVLLMTASLLSTCSASRRPTANFTLTGSGSCLVLGDPISTPVEFPVYTGTGAFNFAGFAGARLYDVSASPPGAIYDSAWFFRITQQQLTVTWMDNSISVRFLPKDNIAATFLDNIEFEEGPTGDYVFIGDFFDDSQAPLLAFRATYTDAAGTHSISGIAIIESFPYEQSGVDGYYVVVALFNSNGDGIVEFAWFSTSYDFDEVTPTVTIPAADQIVSQVVINN